MRESVASGSIFGYLGIASGATAVGLYALMEFESERKRRFANEFQTRLSEDVRKGRLEQREREAAMKDAVPLYSAVLTKTYPGLNGPLMLNGARAGAEVDVLEENVGSDGGYHTVRDKRSGRSGFYPIVWVERKDDPVVGYTVASNVSSSGVSAA